MPLGLSKTTKTHYLLTHVWEFCEEEGKGLASSSEQAFEHLHSQFAKISKYRLPDVTSSPGYAKALLKVVKDFNILHF